MNIRRELCGINKIGAFDKWNCFKRFRLKLADSASSTTQDEIVGEEPDTDAPAGACDPDSCELPGGTTGNVRRSLDGRAATCCMKGMTARETKDPKTGKTKMECVPETTCPAGQIPVKKTDPRTKKVTTECTCPAGQIATKTTDTKTKKAITTCKCPPGQTAKVTTNPRTKEQTTICTCPAGQTLKPQKNPRTGKTTNVCSCPAGQKPSTKLDPNTKKQISICVPIGGPTKKPDTGPKKPPGGTKRPTPGSQKPVGKPPAKKGPRL